MDSHKTSGRYNPQPDRQTGQGGQYGQAGQAGQGMQASGNIQSASGMQTLLDDQTIAADLLTATKEAVKAYASALTEAATPEVRSVLQRQFQDSLQFQHEVADYVIGKGWYMPYDLQTQLQMDLQSSQQKLQSVQQSTQSMPGQMRS